MVLMVSSHVEVICIMYSIMFFLYGGFDSIVDGANLVRGSVEVTSEEKAWIWWKVYIEPHN